MATVEERVSYIEGRMDSLATKEDLVKLEARLVKWVAMLHIVGMSAVAGAVAAIVKLLGD